MDTLHKQHSLLPDTSRSLYLTGMTALNIPSPNGTGGDWHFNEAFYGRGSIKPKIFLAGEGEALNTNDILHDFGIYECSSILRKAGIPIAKQEKVYAANHYRAVLDMLYRCVRLLKSYPSHLDIDDWLDDEQQKKNLLEYVHLLKPYLETTEWEMIQSWLSQQV